VSHSADVRLELAGHREADAKNGHHRHEVRLDAVRLDDALADVARGIGERGNDLRLAGLAMIEGSADAQVEGLAHFTPQLAVHPEAVSRLRFGIEVAGADGAEVMRRIRAVAVVAVAVAVARPAPADRMAALGGVMGGGQERRGRHGHAVLKREALIIQRRRHGEGRRTRLGAYEDEGDCH
jgi:hypothetical protein